MSRGRALVYGALAVGVLDILDAFAFWGLKGTRPVRILQSIAAGLLGRPAAFEGGLATAALGAALHFLIALCVVGAYHLASRRLPVLTRRAVACGLAYGVLVHLFMSQVVIPLSALGPGRFALPVFLNGIIGHALLVGLPAANSARWAARYSR